MIEVTLDFMLLKRKMSSKELAEKVGITPANLSILKTGKAHGVRFDTLSKICEVLDCQPGDLLVYKKDEEYNAKSVRKMTELDGFTFYMNDGDMINLKG